MGFAALKQHSEKQKYRGLAGVDLSSEGKPKQQSFLSQYFVKKVEDSDAEHETIKEETPSTSTAAGQWTVQQLATKAEIIATLQHVGNNVPFAQAENLGACYQEQFPDSLIAKNVLISPNKMSYLVGYGLQPYSTQQTIQELVDGNSFFTLHFDETVTAQANK